MPDAGPTAPDIYRLLSVFSGLPLKTHEALERAGLRVPVTDPRDRHDPGLEPLSDAHRALLRELDTASGRIRWVKWKQPNGKTLTGYVLTGFGEAALDVYHHLYGPAHAPRRGPPLAELAALNGMRDQLMQVLRQRRASL